MASQILGLFTVYVTQCVQWGIGGIRANSTEARAVDYGILSSVSVAISR
jgi:hypothetical protein